MWSVVALIPPRCYVIEGQLHVASVIVFEAQQRLQVRGKAVEYVQGEAVVAAPCVSCLLVSDLLDEGLPLFFGLREPMRIAIGTVVDKVNDAVQALGVGDLQ